MDISNYNLKDTTKCECGHEFDIHEINGLLNIDNHGFFSNIVKTCSLVHCPKCNKETVLFLKQKGQTWEILAIGVKDIKENNVALEATKEKNVAFEATIENKEKNNLNNELICPICKREFKNKIGLTSHMRTHNN